MSELEKSSPNRVVEFMRQPTAYRERPRSVETIETHISWVFLTERFAYKLKKPVKFDFLDFSTPQQRRKDCWDELRLNRRLAADVYVAVLAVTEDSTGGLQLDGRGTEVDWVVQMKRLPAEKALDRMIREDRLAPADARGMAKFLADYYAKLPSQSVPSHDYREALERHIRANQAALLQLLPEERGPFRRVHSAQLRYMNLEARLFDSRALAGRIVDGHGDLRPEHIYLTDPPAVIDCIEFSEELRRVDIADELNFLAMECERLGHRDVGELVLATYGNASGDDIPHRLSSFYRTYRACVRAKVTSLQAQQHSEDEKRLLVRVTQQYHEWADHHAAALGAPCLLVVFGLMGTGKSTLAKNVAQAFDVEVLSTDYLRRTMLGASALPASYGAGRYRSEMRGQIYDELLRKASGLLEEGQSVVLDGTFQLRSLRDRANQLSRRRRARALCVLCECPRATALARIQARKAAGGGESEGRVDLYDEHSRDFEAPSGDETTVRVDTTSNESCQLRVVYDGLREVLFSEDRA